MNENVSRQTDFSTELFGTGCAVVFYLNMYVVTMLGKALGRDKFFFTETAGETLPKVTILSMPINLGPGTGGKFTHITVFSLAFMGNPDMH